MAAYKLYSIVLVLLLAQLSFAQPTNQVEETPASAAVKEKFYAFVREKSNEAVNILRQLIKDESFVNNQDQEVAALRHHLTRLSQGYDKITKIDHYLEFLHYFINMPKHYMELSANRMTTGSKLIEELLLKYGGGTLALEVEKEFNSFRASYDKLKQNKS